MASVGMTGPPETTVFGSIDAPGTIKGTASGGQPATDLVTAVLVARRSTPEVRRRNGSASEPQEP
jgi:hypothetical protein